MKILVLNSGSSSIKYALFEMSNQHVEISGIIEAIGSPESLHSYQLNVDYTNKKQVNQHEVSSHKHGLQEIFKTLTQLKLITQVVDLLCIGHRVVHGGEKFSQPTIITNEVLEEIKLVTPLAPLHNPANLLGIEEARAYAPNTPQVAVFDTAFHQTLPDYAFQYAVPEKWYSQLAVRRYGFHGTSHFYVAKQVAKSLEKPLESLNIISLHLGNGASMAAIKQGLSIDTSMGMSPLEGLIMGTRSGDLDPAIIFYLQDKLELSCAEIKNSLNKESGLKGICHENDMRAVHQLAESGDKQAQLALAMVSYRIKKYIGAYFAVLGEVDAIVFTGGIGENDSVLREMCCADLKLFGIAVDSDKNRQVSTDIRHIEQEGMPVKILVIATNEELEIALQAKACIA
ncbi:MAG: acetate kinase [Methyloprofundus sp.]|nr:acetate kinase [Methyloprofundus sp.]